MRSSFACQGKSAPSLLKLTSLALAGSLIAGATTSFAAKIDKRKTGSVGSYASSASLARSGGKPGNVDISLLQAL